MALNPVKMNTPDFEKKIDIEEFKDSVLSYFSNIPDLRKGSNRPTCWNTFFFLFILAMLAGINSINQISIFDKVKAQWIRSLIAKDSIPSYGIFWWIIVRIKLEFLRQLLGPWLETLLEGLMDKGIKDLCG